MRHSLSIQKDKPMGEKLAAWVWNLFDSIGLLTAFITIFNLDSVEQAILFMASMTFFGYRVYHLHLDGRKKSLENEEKEFDLKQKKNGKK